MVVVPGVCWLGVVVVSEVLGVWPVESGVVEEVLGVSSGLEVVDDVPGVC